MQNPKQERETVIFNIGPLQLQAKGNFSVLLLTTMVFAAYILLYFVEYRP